MSTNGKNGHCGGLTHFNGLKGAELMIYGLLLLDDRLSAAEITNITCYHPTTVYKTLKRLDAWRLISRQRERPGQRYQFCVKDS